MVRPARLDPDHRAPGALARRSTGRWCSGGSTLIESDRIIGLIERPEYKRRWAIRAWAMRRRALRTGCWTGCEARALWFTTTRALPQPGR